MNLCMNENDLTKECDGLGKNEFVSKESGSVVVDSRPSRSICATGGGVVETAERDVLGRP